MPFVENSMCQVWNVFVRASLLWAEIFDNYMTEAEEIGHTPMIVETTKGIDEENIIEEIKEKRWL